MSRALDFLAAILALALLLGASIAVGKMSIAVFPHDDPWVACGFAFVLGNLSQVVVGDFVRGRVKTEGRE